MYNAVLYSDGMTTTDYDVDGIVREIIANYDITGDHPTMDMSAIDHDAYWAIVARHDLAQ